MGSQLGGHPAPQFGENQLGTAQVCQEQRTRSREGGFSLVEVMIAVVILTILTFTTALVLVPVGREHRSTRETSVANAAAQSILEELHATPFNEILTRYPDGQTIEITELQNGSVQVTYEDPTSDPLIVQVDLSWESRDLGPRSESYFTVRTE